ncbi:hypothetical protein BDP27DRAFT_1240354 [Rhodocollybia butyracea]|uniref:BHLH domain-containing protein n=1 Tax=Rhodocollybia butyracea TaxID=206335 RepID=A0A9P5P8E8_9AGAR|nr:hypothetical protein BDP27DRAFT_1240354 [Rhodocollybia butyracea]
MDFYHAPLSSLADYDYASAALPSRRGAPLENASISVPTLTYSTGNTATLSNEQHLDRRSFSTNPSPSVPKSYRFNPISAPTARSSASVASKRINSKTSNDISDEGEEEEYAQSAGSVDPLQEAVRRQRIESEQKRRDDLRDGYTHLKSMLPSTNQKSSKVKLLNRAARHIKYLNAVRDQLETELETANNELNAYRLREANEAHGWHHYSSY